MRLRKAFQRQRALRQIVQPPVMFGSETFAGPHGRCRGQRVEVVEFKQAGSSFIVIAANEDFPQTLRALDHLIGRGSVADDVAEIGH